MRNKFTFFTHSHSRAIVPFNVSSSSYFITITVPVPPKIRIKIPKLLAKTMQRRFYVHRKDARHDKGDHKPKISAAKSRRFVGMRKVQSMFSNVLGKSNKGLRNRKQRDNKGSFFTRAGGVKLIGHEAENYGLVSEREAVIGRQESARKWVEALQREDQSHGTFGVVGSSRKFGSNKFDLRCLDLKLNGTEEESESLELCKKRILMGSKCKPLTISGSLHYDQNGILLPEEIP